MAKTRVADWIFNPVNGTIELLGNIRSEQALLITNTTTNNIIYNFADATLGGVFTFDPATEKTTIDLDFDTSAMSSSDSLQIFIDTPGTEIYPGENFADPVDKLRGSAPESLIDTDFEYSLQPFKWETTNTINSRPSIYVRSNEPAFTAEEITSITVENSTQFINSGFESTTYAVNNISTGSFNSSSITAANRYSYNAYVGGQYYNFCWVYPNAGLLVFNSSLSNYSYPLYEFDPAAYPWNQVNFYAIKCGGLDSTSQIINAFQIGNSYTSSTFTFPRNSVDNGTTFGIRINSSYNSTTRSIDVTLRTRNGFNNNFNPDIIFDFPNWLGNDDLEFWTANTANGIMMSPTNLGGTAAGNISNSAIIYESAADAYAYRATIQTTTAHNLTAGVPIVLKETDQGLLDGAHVVTNVNSTLSFSVRPNLGSDFSSPVKSGSFLKQANTDIGIVTITNHGFKPGQSIFINFSTTLITDGVYQILDTPATTQNSFPIRVADAFSNQVSTSVNQVSNSYNTEGTALYTSGFYDKTEITGSLYNVQGQKSAKFVVDSDTYAGHGLSVGSKIYMFSDQLSENSEYVGAFIVKSIPDRYSLVFDTLGANSYLGNTLVTDQAVLRIRPDGGAVHRVADGGVQINVGSSGQNAQVIRQTRKYFRYQSGKGTQFSSGVLFKPSYDIAGIVAVYDGTDLLVEIETLQDHGFAQPDSNLLKSALISVSGVVVSSGSNEYNGNFEINSIVNSKKFIVTIPSATVTDLAPGGSGIVDVVEWNDSVVRSGLFDDQNGLFFEYSGDKGLCVVKRSSTKQLPGTVSMVSGTNILKGAGTKFSTVVKVGDTLNIRGLNFPVVQVISDTKLLVGSNWRGESSIYNVNYQVVREDRYYQNQFNIDRMDGTGPSGYIFNASKMQMIYIDYSWYGAGRIRYGMRSIDGSIKYFHYIKNNNINTEAYMRSGNLPGRFEIVNVPSITDLTTASSDESATFDYIGSNNNFASITLNGHGFTEQDSIYVTSTADASLIPLGLVEISEIVDTNTIRVLVAQASQSTVTGSLTIKRGIPASQTTPFSINVVDASSFPTYGTIKINNEYMQYTKTNSQELQIVARNVYQLEEINNIRPGEQVTSFNCNFTPTLSHWGTAVIMDGGFQKDKSYLFTAATFTGRSFSSGQVPIISIRLAPSVDYGTPASYGTRGIVNRSLLSLYAIGIQSNQPQLVTVKLNCAGTFSTNFSNNWVAVANGSLAQRFIHTSGNGTVTGGDTIFEFFAAEGVTTTLIDEIRELGNGILGGQYIYPDGPDILTVFVSNLGTTSSSTRARVSWTESQG